MPDSGLWENRTALVKSPGTSNSGAGSRKASTCETTLSIPLPRSSQIRNRRISDARVSLRDFGGVSTKRSVSTSGSPGLVI